LNWGIDGARIQAWKSNKFPRRVPTSFERCETRENVGLETSGRRTKSARVELSSSFFQTHKTLSNFVHRTGEKIDGGEDGEDSADWKRMKRRDQQEGRQERGRGGEMGCRSDENTHYLEGQLQRSSEASEEAG